MVVKSIANNDDDILLGIIQLHNAGQPFDLDPTFSRGGFYRTGRVPMPLYRYDLTPPEGVGQADVTALPLADRSIGSVVCDLPFMFNHHGNARERNQACRRFTMFDDWASLERTYRGALAEFRRILRPKGIVAFKCQDYTDSRTTMTHCHVWQWATQIGFYAKDLFIRYRLHGPAYTVNKQQRHARKFHSYWFVFESK